MFQKSIRIIFCLWFSGVLALSVFAQNQIGQIIKLDSRNDDQSKIPLILIHGIHGKSDDWNAFMIRYGNDEELKKYYIIYSFQYLSDRVSVRDISEHLGDEIDNKLKARRPMLVAHSMGGLVAKNYMVYYKHRNIRGYESGGDRVLGLITLATPHHGTPGANDVSALTEFITESSASNAEKEDKIRNFYLLNATYWNQDEFLKYAAKAKKNCVEDHKWMLESTILCLKSVFTINDLKTLSLSSTAYNRKDLRWDNYDNKIQADANTELLETNRIFEKYSDKVILYAGLLKPLEPQIFNAIDSDNHVKLNFADGVLYYGLNRAFGYTDGLVPYKSAMLCNSNQQANHDFQCESPFRVRRFEFGDKNKVFIPNPKTLSITKTSLGFDHQDMRDSGLVLDKVKEDLLSFASNFVSTNPNPLPPKPIPVLLPDIPTLFLFDVSGSMNDNDKIGQARTSSLLAMSEIQKNKQRGSGASSVSVWAFSGDCAPNAGRQILPFTSDLTQAENTLRLKIPRPDGGTPLPQAIEKATAQVNGFLNARPDLNEGRIVLLSDGQSTCGEIRPAGIYSQARTITVKKIRFLTIGFDVAPGSAAERDLQYLASASGGQYFPAQNQQQLSRAFEKTIRVYLPKAVANASPEFENVTNAILNRDFQRARQFAAEYLQKNPADAFGYYNFAVALEASSRYKGAAENYRKYLQLAPGAADKLEIEERAAKLEQDYRDQFFYYQKLLQSDLDYLKAYYQKLFNRENEKNAAEFAGFVVEKREFYANLTDILEIRSSRIERDAKDLSDSLEVLNRRVGLPSFDRDAVSLLTISVGQLEDVIERLGNYDRAR